MKQITDFVRGLALGVAVGLLLSSAIPARADTKIELGTGLTLYGHHGDGVWHQISRRYIAVQLISTGAFLALVVAAALVFWLVLGQVVGVHLDPAFIDESGTLRLTEIKPIARCGGLGDYAVVESLFQMDRPT